MRCSPQRAYPRPAEANLRLTFFLCRLSWSPVSFALITPDLQADADTHATDRAAGAKLMKYIADCRDRDPPSSFDRRDSADGRRWGDEIGLAFLVAAPAVEIHEAWTKKRGVLGCSANIVVSLVGAFLFAPLGGMVIVTILSPFMEGRRWRPGEDP